MYFYAVMDYIRLSRGVLDNAQLDEFSLGRTFIIGLFFHDNPKFLRSPHMESRIYKQASTVAVNVCLGDLFLSIGDFQFIEGFII